MLTGQHGPSGAGVIRALETAPQPSFDHYIHGSRGARQCAKTALERHLSRKSVLTRIGAFVIVRGPRG
jgi:hypothetical protein